MSTSIDPVYQLHGEWWFWDETGAEPEGPYATEAECRAALASYIVWLHGTSDLLAETLLACPKFRKDMGLDDL